MTHPLSPFIPAMPFIGVVLGFAIGGCPASEPQPLAALPPLDVRVTLSAPAPSVPSIDAAVPGDAGPFRFVSHSPGDRISGPAAPGPGVNVGLVPCGRSGGPSVGTGAASLSPAIPPRPVPRGSCDEDDAREDAAAVREWDRKYGPLVPIRQCPRCPVGECPATPAEKAAVGAGWFQVKDDRADPENLVEIAGPPEAEPGGYFIVSVKGPVPSETVAADAIRFDVTPTAPDGAIPPLKLLSETPGERLFLYQRLVPGRYVFRAVAQVAVAPPAFDPHDEDELVVTVTAPQPPPVVTPTTPAIPPTEKATAAVYVYEKDDTPVPPAVLSALNRLNREKHVVGTLFEADTKDGTGEVPEQYKAALDAAKGAGLPALVVIAGKAVARVVKNPQTEADVIGAVQ